MLHDFVFLLHPTRWDMFSTVPLQGDINFNFLFEWGLPDFSSEKLFSSLQLVITVWIVKNM